MAKKAPRPPRPAKKAAAPAAAKETPRAARPATVPNRVAQRLYLEMVAEPGDMDEYAARYERDDMFSFGLRIVCATILAADPVCAAAGDTPRDKAMAEHLTRVFLATLPTAIKKAFGRGCSAFEVWGRYDPKADLHVPGGCDYLEFGDRTLRLAPDGRPDGVTLRIGRGEPVHLPPARVWWLAFDATPKNPHGQPQFGPAAEDVLRERLALKFNHAVWLQKQALGHGVIKAPSEYPPLTVGGQQAESRTNPDGTPADPLTDGANYAEAIRSGGTIALPSEHHPPHAGGGPMWDYQEPRPQVTEGPFGAEWQRLNDKALRSIGVPERSATQGDAGTYAMADSHRGVLIDLCESLLAQACRLFGGQVCATYARLNGLKAPEVTFTHFDQEAAAAVMELVKRVVEAPTLPQSVAGGFVDLDKLLTAARIPKGGDLTKKLAALQQQQQQAQQPQMAPPPPGGPPGPGAAPAGPVALSMGDWGDDPAAWPLGDEEPPAARWEHHHDRLSARAAAALDELLHGGGFDDPVAPDWTALDTLEEALAGELAGANAAARLAGLVAPHRPEAKGAAA